MQDMILSEKCCFRCVLNGADRDYYNDLPGKIPPEAGPPPVPPLPNLHPPTLASASTVAAATAVMSTLSCPPTSETVLRDWQHPVVQRAQSDRAVGVSCRGKHSHSRYFVLVCGNKGHKFFSFVCLFVGLLVVYFGDISTVQQSSNN